MLFWFWRFEKIMMFEMGHLYLNYFLKNIFVFLFQQNFLVRLIVFTKFNSIKLLWKRKFREMYSMPTSIFSMFEESLQIF